MIINDYFGEDVIGQDHAKRTLNFVIESQRKTGYLRPLFITSARGYGKTTIARKIAENLIDKEGNRKPFIEINGAALQKLTSFINQVVAIHIANFRPVTLFIDEIHAVSDDVKNWLLTVLQTGPENRSRHAHGDQEFEFDFHQFSFLAATTNPEKLSFSFRERMRKVDLAPYSPFDLIKILRNNLKGIEFSDGIENNIIGCGRRNPRMVVAIARDVYSYCETNSLATISPNDWNQIRQTFDIKPLGLHTNEIGVLRNLENYGPQTLTTLSAKLGLASNTVRQDVENYLLANNLIAIDGKRMITRAGREILMEC